MSILSYGCGRVYRNGGVSAKHIVSTVVDRVADIFADEAQLAAIRREIRPQEWSNVMWSLASVGIDCNDRQVRTLLTGYYDNVTPSMLRSWKGQELNNICWSLAKILTPVSPVLRGRDYDFLESFAKVVREKVNGFKSRDVSTVLYALSSLGWEGRGGDRSVYYELCGKGMGQAWWTPQEVSNSVYGLAKLGIGPEEDARVARFYEEAKKTVLKKMAMFKPQEVKDVLWGFSKGGVYNPGLFGFVAGESRAQRTERSRLPAIQA